jgi:glycogenin glucosyltransferase
MSTRRAYVTLLATPDFLPGVAVLAESLRRVRSRHPLFVVVTDGIDARTAERAGRHAAGVIRVEAVAHPAPAATSVHWNHTYSKLRIFGLAGFEKLVFLDADMLVCANLDELFERPHFSAVNAGGLLPEHRDWVTVNSGLLVVEPDAERCREMLSRVGHLPVRDHGDQSCLHAYFPEWPQREDLHLDHGYNIFHDHLDRYASLLGYRLPRREEAVAAPGPGDARLVRVIHFVGGLKPWHRGYRIRHARGYLRPGTRPLGQRANRMWYGCEWSAWLRGGVRR